MQLIQSSLAGVLLLGVVGAFAPAATPTLSIDVGKPVGPVSRLMYGLMTEEINHSYDGGLYAELIHNRVMRDDAKSPAHWSAVKNGASAATIALNSAAPLNEQLPVSLRVDVTAATKDAPAGVANGGYWGIPVKPDTTYRASFYAKAASGFTGPITLAIQSDDGKTTYATTTVDGLTDEWKQFTAVLKTDATAKPTTKARYALLLNAPGTVWLNLVSLFPPTFNDRPNGFRPDLMQMLVDLHPKFLRFPGGNFLEGDKIETRFEWKKTLGPLADRPGHQGPWGYRSTDGMGLLEFLHWCEDMKAEPVLALYAGYSLSKVHVDAGPALEPFVQEALEEIEYVIGDAKTTTWGARRAQDGHPEPFKLTYVEVGNEDWFDTSMSYDARYAQFHDAIKAKYPQLKIISSVGNEQPKFLVKSRKPDVLDEHYYRATDEFVKMSPRYYDDYPRDAGRPEIFVGEWAAHEDAKIKPWFPAARKQPPTPNMKAALGDAVFMAAMERNADIVTMHCYAPLLVNVNPGAFQWRPNLIGYDAMRSFGAPSYYAIKLFSTNLGDQQLRLKTGDTPVQASATRDAASGTVFVKLVNPTTAAAKLTLELTGVSGVEPTATVQTLAASPEATNTLDKPKQVVPADSTINDVKPSFDYTVPANGIVVLTVKTK